MKALTLHQPAASLVAVGVKTIETRSWSTRYRGPLAIHAAARPLRERLVIGDYEAWPPDARNRPHPNHPDGRPARLYWNDGPWLSIGSWTPLPLGAVVATCTLTDVVPIVQGIQDGDPSRPFLFTRVPDSKLVKLDCTVPISRGWQDLEHQRTYGDFTPGRWAWLLSDIAPLAEPAPARGRQGLWEWSWDPTDEYQVDPESS